MTTNKKDIIRFCIGFAIIFNEILDPDSRIAYQDLPRFRVGYLSDLALCVTAYFTKYSVPSTLQQLCTKYWVPSTLIPSTWFQALGTKYLGTKHLGTRLV